ncbi:Uncharacterized protein APZ42_027962 [Daphnia magna]|uniref:Uncharacterized protein n=1 Tax=Daphnia magna TaxID=35525 RepID=A0A164QY31_9CRUS|nr:Uncharacterized protein APZ42_027962 [Daphnia magna]
MYTVAKLTLTKFKVHVGNLTRSISRLPLPSPDMISAREQLTIAFRDPRDVIASGSTPKPPLSSITPHPSIDKLSRKKKSLVDNSSRGPRRDMSVFTTDKFLPSGYTDKTKTKHTKIHIKPHSSLAIPYPRVIYGNLRSRRNR